MRVIKAPNKWVTEITKERSIFLAGSIEMGVAENWQEKLTRLLADKSVLLLNPRRDDWDSSWEQKIENDKFREQVEWELDAMERAGLVVMYFDKTTKSPITLLELGIVGMARRHDKAHPLIVCCPEGFWRKGNVDIVCKRLGIKQVDTIEQLAEEIRGQI